YVRDNTGTIVLRRQLLPHPAVTPLVVDGTDFKLRLSFVVYDRKQFHVADHFWGKVLQDKTVVAEILHHIKYLFQPVLADQVGKPGLVLLGRLLTNALEVHENIEAQGIRVESGVELAVVFRLKKHAAMALDKLQHEAVVEVAFLKHLVDDMVMHK